MKTKIATWTIKELQNKEFLIIKCFKEWFIYWKCYPLEPHSSIIVKNWFSQTHSQDLVFLALNCSSKKVVFVYCSKVCLRKMPTRCFGLRKATNRQQNETTAFWNSDNSRHFLLSDKNKKMFSKLPKITGNWNSK